MIKITLKSVKMTQKIFSLLPVISATEFQNPEWTNLGFISVKGVQYFILQNQAQNSSAKIPCQMWTLVDQRGWKKPDYSDWQVRGVGCLAGENLNFASPCLAKAFIASQRDTSTPPSAQLFF
jgi:hypothetical protein